MDRLPTIQELHENESGLSIGDKIKFKPEALADMSEPELINTDLVYDVVKTDPRIVIEDPYGNAQKINKKDIKYLVKQLNEEKDVKSMTVPELRAESEEYDKIIADNKAAMDSVSGRERTDTSDTYFLPRELKTRFREVNDELARKIDGERGTAAERMPLRRELRKWGVQFDPNISLEELKKLHAEASKKNK